MSGISPTQSYTAQGYAKLQQDNVSKAPSPADDNAPANPAQEPLKTTGSRGTQLNVIA